MNDNNTYYKMPKFLFSENLALSPQAKILYTLLLDRERASEALGSPFRDEDGKIFILYKYENAARLLGCHKSTVGVYMKELRDKGLLKTEKTGDFNHRIYLNLSPCSEIPCTGNTNGADWKFQSTLIGNPEHNKNLINKNSFNKNTQKKKKCVEEIPKPSYDLDAYTRKAFENPMRIYEKEKSTRSPLP